MSISLITDRTQLDANRAKNIKSKFMAGGWEGLTPSEHIAFKAGLKGAYNYADLNRVGEAIFHIAARLNSAGYSVSVTPKMDWTMADIPTAAQMTIYLTDVATIRAALAVRTTTPPTPPDMVDLTVEEANAIEHILQDVDGLITNMIAAYFYAGEIYAGEV